MKNNVQKNILFLALAGLVLVGGNMAVLMATWNEQLAPIDNQMLWVAFVIFNVCSLLWAMSLLGLQPLLVAVSYVAGGALAFQGVRLLPDINIAEVTTAGATYGAFGALMVSHATARVRMPFFQRAQVPFIFAIIALLVISGFLNSRVLSAGWGVIVNALVVPFVLSGVMIGLIWMILSRMGIARKSTRKPIEAVSEIRAEPIMDSKEDTPQEQLMIKVPENIGLSEVSEEISETSEDTEWHSEPESIVLEASKTPLEPLLQEEEPPQESSSLTDFFPLEIDKGDDGILEQEASGLMDLAVQIAENAAEQVVEVEPDVDDFPLPDEVYMEQTAKDLSASMPELPPILNYASPEPEPEPVMEPEASVKPPKPKEEKADSSDWLSGHLDLLNKLN